MGMFRVACDRVFGSHGHREVSENAVSSRRPEGRQVLLPRRGAAAVAPPSVSLHRLIVGTRGQCYDRRTVRVDVRNGMVRHAIYQAKLLRTGKPITRASAMRCFSRSFCAWISDCCCACNWTLRAQRVDVAAPGRHSPDLGKLIKSLCGSQLGLRSFHVAILSDDQQIVRADGEHHRVAGVFIAELRGPVRFCRWRAYESIDEKSRAFQDPVAWVRSDRRGQPKWEIRET